MMKSIVFLLTFVAGIIAASGYFRAYQWSASGSPTLNGLKVADFRDTDQFHSRAKKELQDEINKKIVMSFYQEVFFDRNVDAVDKYVDKHTYIQHNPNVPDGKDVVVALIKSLKAKTEVHHVGSDGDLVYVHVKNTYELDGRTDSVVDIYRVQDQKIVEHWDVTQTYKLFANDHPFF